MATRTDQSEKKGNVLWPCQHQRAAGTCPKFHLVGQVLRGGRRLTPSPGGNPAPRSQWDMQEGGTGNFASLASLPLIPGCSRSFQAGGSHRGGNGNAGATFLCCPGVKGSSGIAATTDRLFPFSRKSLDGTQMDAQNSRLPRSKAEKWDSSEHNLCSLPRARIKALQGEHFLGTSVPLQGSEVSLCTPQMRETSLVDQREALERETGLGTLLL